MPKFDAGTTIRHGRNRQQRDLVCVRDIPPLDAHMPDLSDKYRVSPEQYRGYKSNGISRRPTPRYQKPDDYRDEGVAVHGDVTPREQPRDSIEEYYNGESSSVAMADDYGSKGGSLSVESRLDYSLGRLSSENSLGSVHPSGAHNNKPHLAVTTDDIAAIAFSELTPRTNNLNSTQAGDGGPQSMWENSDHMAANTSRDQPLQYSLSNTSSVVDRRWEALRAKYEEESVKTDLSSSSGDSSDDIHTLLDVNESNQLSPKSLSSQALQDLLIEDCVETGLPAPSTTATLHDQGATKFQFSERRSRAIKQPLPNDLLFQGVTLNDNQMKTKPNGNLSDDEKRIGIHDSLPCSSSTAGSSRGAFNSGKPAQRVNQDDRYEITNESPTKHGLLWWRKNGKRLVEEKLGRTPKQEGDGFHSGKNTPRSASSVESSEESRQTQPELPERTSTPTFDARHSTSHSIGTSAFSRRLSVFEKQPTIDTSQYNSRSQTAALSSASNGSLATSPLTQKVNRSGGRHDEVVGSEIAESTRSRPRQEDSSADDGASCLVSPRARDNPKEEQLPSRVTKSFKKEWASCTQKGKSGFFPPTTTKKILVGQHEIDFSHDSKSLGSRSNSDDNDYAADILDVSSSLTHDTYKKGDDDVNNTAVLCPTPVAARVADDEESKTVELVVGVKKMASFDAKGCAVGAGIPSWRIDQTESFWNFKLGIKSMVSGHVDDYYVHKHVMGVGPRSSKVLQKFFRKPTNSSTELTVKDEAAAFVPNVLDYIYCDDYDLDLNTENVLAYRHIANVSRIPSILKKTAEFILTDMDIPNVNVYTAQCSLYNDETIMNYIAAKCGEEIENIPITDPVWEVMNPKFFLQVISCPKIDLKTASRRLSLLVVEYHALHERELRASTFLDMTSVAVLPLIDREAAIPILEICDAYVAPETLQKLQKRCAHVMACNWKTTTDAERKRFFTLLRTLPATFTVDFLEMVDSGKSAGLVDNALLKMLDGFRLRRDSESKYEGRDSFSVAKLCGSEEGEDDTEQTLSWRMDSSQSFSDWAIKIKHEETKELDIYHVHKHMLAIGQYKSTFFADAFMTGGQATNSNGSMTIELPEQSASVFSDLLDFVYSPDHPVVLSTRTAPLLRYLARVFGAYMLNKKVIEFLQNDIDSSNMIHYLDDADAYDDERIRNIVVHKCARDIRQIDTESQLLLRVPPALLGRIIASGDIDKSASCHINVLIAKYFSLHDLDENLLAELMKQVQMKEIDQDSALQLLHVMGSVKNKNIAIFSEICQRCTAVVVENWKDLRQQNREECFRILRTLGDSCLVADIFDAVEQDSHENLADTVNAQSRLVQRYRTHLAEAESRRQTDLNLLKKEHDLLVTELLKKQKDLESQLEGFQKATTRRALRSNSGGFRLPSPLRRTSSSPTGAEDLNARFEHLWAKIDRRGFGKGRAGGETPSNHDEYPPLDLKLTSDQPPKVQAMEDSRSRAPPERVPPEAMAQYPYQKPTPQPRLFDPSHQARLKSECEAHVSIFNQVFGCTPEQVFDEDQQFVKTASLNNNDNRTNLFPPVAREHLDAVDGCFD